MPLPHWDVKGHPAQRSALGHILHFVRTGTLHPRGKRVLCTVLATTLVLVFLVYGSVALLAWQSPHGAVAATTPASPAVARLQAVASAALSTLKTTATVATGGHAPIELPYGSGLVIPESHVHTALHRAFGGAPEARAVSVKRLVGGGAINAVFQVLLACNVEVIVKFGSPFWAGCNKALGEAAIMTFVAQNSAIPVPRVLAALPEWNNMPDVLIMEKLPGKKLQLELQRPLSEVPLSTRWTYMEQWIAVFAELRRLSFDAYGSFQANMKIGPLTANGGCSDQGPFSTYSEYAAGKIAMFFRLVEAGVCPGLERTSPLMPALKCYVESVKQYVPAASDDLHPVLQHSDLSVRNLLVLDEPDGSQPRISGVLDWEFAIAGPAEEEFTFFATMEGLSDSDTHVFQEVLKTAVVQPPDTAQERANHIEVYAALINFCHAHAWKDNASFTDEKRHKLYSDTKLKLTRILQEANCMRGSF